jgi:hypothetical protein
MLFPIFPLEKFLIAFFYLGGQSLKIKGIQTTVPPKIKKRKTMIY